MYWNEDSNEKAEYQVPDDIIDVNFKIKCAQLKLDHADALSQAMCRKLPWLKEDPDAGIFSIHGAESGNGWIRPQNPEDLIYPSRRTLFTLRISKERLVTVETLQGEQIEIDGVTLEFGKSSVRPLSRLTTLFCRYVDLGQAPDEDIFLQQALKELQALGIQPKKMMCGKITQLILNGQPSATRSLMLDGIDVEQSVLLQQRGIGAGRLLGCGLFIPHKGIDAINEAQEK